MRVRPLLLAQAREIGAIAAETPQGQGEAVSNQTNAAWFPICPLGRVVSLVSLSPSPDTPSSSPMSSLPPSPSPDAPSTLPVSSPPFTPVRNASKKLPPASLPSDASSRPALMLVTPNQTPLGPANRFGVLASSNRVSRLDPKTPASKPRVPLSASNSPVEENWRSTRKRDLPPTPNGAPGEYRVRRL